jgi:predicted glutamine amidotransferase
MHVFAHNGNLEGLRESPVFRPRRFQPVGETDSEWAFCILLDRIAQLWWTSPPAVPPLQKRLHDVAEFAAAIRPFGPANFIYADGDALFAHGHRRLDTASGLAQPPGLVTLSRWCADGNSGPAGRGVSVSAADQVVTFVASVPLTDEAWQPLAEGEILAIQSGQCRARLRP